MEYNIFIEKFKTIKNCIEYSNTKLFDIKESIKSIMTDIRDDIEFTIITTGSFGRKEASEQSDLDLFIFCSNVAAKEIIEKKTEELKNIVKQHIDQNNGSTGTFGSDAIDVFDDILKNIGGNQDKNEFLTRRMLLLLEGTSLYGEEAFNKYRDMLINKYIDATTEGGYKIDKFLLNDIIRYYRTITTDFQYKVEEDGKSWGLRNIKLRFSRKLLYFAGILTVAEVFSDKNSSDKLKNISSHLDKPPLERIYEILKIKLHPLAHEIFSEYESFLSTICESDKRMELENIKMKPDRLNSVLYSDLNNKSNLFTENLYKILMKLYGNEHPIHNALIF